MRVIRVTFKPFFSGKFSLDKLIFNVQIYFAIVISEAIISTPRLFLDTTGTNLVLTKT